MEPDVGVSAADLLANLRAAIDYIDGEQGANAAQSRASAAA
jgi:hypothetical protein